MVNQCLRNTHWLTLCFVVLLAGCVQNPVTGARELGFIGTADEVAIGRQHYGPTQQMEGGEYVLEPALSNYVADVTARLARLSDRELPYEIVVLNSSVPNAWALPGGKMAINRGLLLELESEAELAAVIGHEIIHAAARHGARNIERGMLLEGAMLIAAMAAEDTQYLPFVVVGAQLGAALITQRHSREAEREADLYGMQLMHRAGYDPYAAVTLQETFVRLSEDRRSNWLTGLFASHPPSAERVANNRATAERLGSNGELGRDSHQQAIAELRRRAPAFEAADAGRAALGKRDYAAAEAKILEAIELEPAEASFHGLLGELRLRQNRPEAAIAAFDRALERHEGYYGYWQGRGLAQLQLGQRPAARSDLERGASLLPTAIAMNSLGQLELAAGRQREAREYLNLAAGAGGPAAEQARMTLARLDLPNQPERFFSTRSGVDERGRLIIEVSNRSPLTTGGVVVEVRLQQEDGRVASRRVNVPGRLPANESVRFQSGLNLPVDTPAERVSTRVVAARVVD
ncbi:MAG: M48 family metalloprotease [Gammaproteobacteria bacterium]|nr:M48 family metalloprotease [Gammaproteobacteria bacterium]